MRLNHYLSVAALALLCALALPACSDDDDDDDSNGPSNAVDAPDELTKVLPEEEKHTFKHSWIAVANIYINVEEEGKTVRYELCNHECLALEFKD